MRNRFDHTTKELGKRALGPSGTTVAHAEIMPEIQHADLLHEPDPARDAERERLGLLGRMAAMPCLIEVYSHAPTPEELRACLAKHIAHWQQCTRTARTRNRKRDQTQPSEPFEEPFLWIIAAGTPAAILTQLRSVAAPGWPTGVYFIGDNVLRVGIIVAGELPHDRSTLLVRLMASGPLLGSAIRELGRLPADSHERAVAELPILKLQYVLEQQPSRTPEDQETLTAMQMTWEDRRIEGRAEERANVILDLLRVRGIAVPAAARERIVAQRDMEQLQRWFEKAVVAASISDVLDEPS